MRNTPVKTFFGFFLALLFALSLSACGGGGGDDAGGAFGSGGGAGTGGDSGGGGDTTGGTTGISIGSFSSNNNFQKGNIGIGQSPLAAGGSSSLSVAFVDADGIPVSDVISVTFISICLTQGKAAIVDAGGNPANPVTTIGGGANATYVDKGCQGTDDLIARATIGEDVLEATGSIEVLPSSVGGLQFISATPDVIGIKGTGILLESSQVIFQVNDSSSNPASGKAVQFELDTSVGGITLSTDTATSGADGRVSVVVTSGTQATSVRVRAVTEGEGGVLLTTESDALAITTGVADADSFSGSVASLNVQGLDFDGVENEIIIRAADAVNNIVPDGFNINFNTEAGAVVGSCKTGVDSGPQDQPESGTCSVTWRSQDPRPGAPSISPPSVADGINSVFASALGVESFVDKDGDNRFDDDEFDPDNDLGEPFRDDNDNFIYDVGEFFIDYDLNGEWTPPNGMYDGLLCDEQEFPQDPHDDGVATNCNKRVIAVGATLRFVVSGSNPIIALNCSPVTPVAGAETECTVTVTDVNGNPMAGGTTVGLSANDYSVAAPASFTVPDTADQGPGATEFTFFVTAPDTCPEQDNLRVTVGVPAPGSITVFETFPINCTP